ncbi:MAG: hypothetical protein AB2A00_27730 [Myxococcota bacterium]
MRNAVILATLVLTACPKPSSQPDGGAEVVTSWGPGMTLATAREPNARGLLDRRGLIHAHSWYSHDACDNLPRDDAGVRDAVCFEDFRRGLCQSKHDFVMLTDHRDMFNDVEYPDALLYRPERGDRLVERNGSPVASWAACPDEDTTALIMAGCEAGTMPVGLEHHVADTHEERSNIYGGDSANDIQALKAAGAVALVAHTEGWTVEQLTGLPLDGFEMYNLHANTLRAAGEAFVLLQRLSNGDPGMPHPDLAVLPLIAEDPRYLETWGTVLARGARRVTTMGTDCHRNTFKQTMQDGERIDSYRRMMIWFSNHLLIRPRSDGTWTDLELKEALSSGRLYGAFEYLGYPVGFDYHALEGGEPREMGAEVSLARGVELVATMPSVEKLDPKVDAPVLTMRVLRAVEGGWEEVHRSTTNVSFAITTPGAYRAEVLMQPRHLVPFLGDDAELYRDEPRVWIYSNAIYVTP